MKNSEYHEPVLAHEVIGYLRLDVPLKKQAYFIDTTVGTAGHTLEILKAGGNVLGIDADKELLEIAEKRLKLACPALNDSVQSHFKLVNGNFKYIDETAMGLNVKSVDGILFDLGVSNLHLKSQTRGFSFESGSAPLDMRIDTKLQSVTAADLLNNLREDQLVALFISVLIQPVAKRLAKEVIFRRNKIRIKNTFDFLAIIKRARIDGGKLNPATLPFMALRMAVNSELENLKIALPKALELLKKGGRLVVISFHSGEDALVKNFFRDMQKEDLVKILTKKPVVPTKEEIIKNPRARSAKLRCLEKI
ncbi:16S rRNA (cytosine(1402)-N(4))-methyltransferase [Candidatus Woesebacteria bacterium]|nr:MAG: 16S rRNA (cytosine(1402)-N(4))-methyltransferase [Candidatus Woesebacteria bacterium]